MPSTNRQSKDTSSNRVPGMGLYSIKNSNHDFELPKCWKKNIFNNAFPVSLAAKMHDKGLPFVYLKLNEEQRVIHSRIDFPSVFGLDPHDTRLYYKFEGEYPHYSALSTGRLPGIDLVTFNRGGTVDEPLRSLEIKLTALPDHSTALRRSPDLYGCELVIRPDSIVYLAMSIASLYLRKQDILRNLLEPTCGKITDWRDKNEMIPLLEQIRQQLYQVMQLNIEQQQPLVLQPIWRTVRQRLLLEENCFDIFVWSNFAFANLFLSQPRALRDINRPSRSFVWLARMLWDFANNGSFDANNITNTLVYSGRNDKAFSISGAITHPIMTCAELSLPRVSKSAVKEIILGNGHLHLQPERRLDAAILTTPDLFPVVPVEDITNSLDNLQDEEFQPLEDEDNESI